MNMESCAIPQKDHAIASDASTPLLLQKNSCLLGSIPV
uniref:Uncharacterized protein n=1 Tax=Anguilla anguilla TaxID=7936 RepID=A0A0E9S0T8_ANGAN